MAGNRDFLLGDEMLQACGVLRLHDPTVLSAFGQRVLLTHGDAWCLADIAYQHFRRQVRDPAWQARALAQTLPERRAVAQHMRSESERHLASRTGPWVDVDSATALHAMSTAQSPTLIHGHTHRPGSDTLAPGFVRHVLSDWDLDHPDDSRAEVLRWQGGDFMRLPLNQARAATS
jgi:UDP-2,3-diacylglucosamine hydrolase